MRSFVTVSPHSHFSIHNIPFGVFSPPAAKPRVGTAIGDYVLDLSVLANAGLLAGNGLYEPADVFSRPSLNELMALGRPVWDETRRQLQQLLSADEPLLRDNAVLREAALWRQNDVTMHLPAEVGDYTDFYSSREHATKVGVMFRGADKALQPNWLHLPVGYHGRASTVVVSGTDVVRPFGQLHADLKDPSKGSIFGPTRRLDYELEVAFFVGGPATEVGRPIRMEEARDRIFGLVLLNDWSGERILEVCGDESWEVLEDAVRLCALPLWHQVWRFGIGVGIRISGIACS